MLALNRWGPSGWHFIHAVMMTSPETLTIQQRQDMKAFLLLFGKHLPCPKCRMHFAEFLQRELRDERLATRDSLAALMNDCHNEVNRRNGKPEFTLREHYEWMTTGHRHTSPQNDTVPRVALCGIISVLVYMTGKKLLSNCENTRHPHHDAHGRHNVVPRRNSRKHHLGA